MSGMTYDICLVYLDDILVFLKTFEEHCDWLSTIFNRLERYTLKLKPTKCHLFQRKVKFLGHVVSGAGIECDPDKVAAIATWPTPTNISEVQTFCGLASYYRTFVQDFAKLAKPLHNLTRKNVTFVWNQECEAAFQALKERLMSAPILVPPRDEGQYVLHMDASDTALGTILQQEQDGQLRVIGYASRALTTAKRRYCITRKELLGIVYGLKKYRQHLLGREIVVRTDHAALVFLKKTPEPVGQQGRWLDLLSEYIIEIQHRPGRAHSNSDALSRRPCERNSGGKEYQQCLRTITGSKAAQAHNAETWSVTGQIQQMDSLPLTPPKSFWEVSYDLPQWFTSDTSTVDTPAPSSFLGSPTSSISTNQAEGSVSPVMPATPMPDSSTNDAAMRVQAITAMPEPPSIMLNDIRTAQAADDNLLPVTQALLDQKRPAHADIRQYPEEARALLAQWDSLVIQDGILYRKFHYPDGTVNFLQIVLPVKLRRPFIERLHSERGHFGRTKTCYAVSRRAYFPGWRSYTGLLVRNCAVCNLHQRSRQTPLQVTLKPMQEFRPMAELHADLVGPLLEGRNSGNQRGFQYILSVVDSATRYLWLLLIQHNTAELVAATFFDEIIARVSVPSAILTNRGGEFLGEVVELLYKRLEMTHLKTSAYRPQTDAKCERTL